MTTRRLAHLSRPGLGALGVLLLFQCAAPARAEEPSRVLEIQTRKRVAVPADRIMEAKVSWDARNTAIIVVDMWDHHPCKGAEQRMEELAPAMNEALKAAREKGVLIIHAPSGCMDFYKDTEQRKLAQIAPLVKSPVTFSWNDRDAKIETSYPDELTRDGHLEGEGICSGCDPACTKKERNWTRQNGKIEIGKSDAVSDDGQEIFNLLKQKEIFHVILVGSQMNTSVVGRPFGLRQMRKTGMDTVLCRDLSDSFYEPKHREISHFKGNEMMTEHIERHLCPTITSSSLTGKPAFRFKGDALTEIPAVVKSANDPTKPVPGGVRWFGRMHAAYVEQTKNKKFDVCFLGDSITQMWPGDHFNRLFGKFNAVNFGIGGDRTENVLWRLENGELVGSNPKLIVLLIGTNNAGMNTSEEIALGVSTVVKSLRAKLPDTKILVQGILPRRDPMRAKTDATKPLLAKLDDGKMVFYHDFGPLFLDKAGTLLDGVLADDVHLTGKGYEIWGTALVPVIEKLLK